MTASEPRPDYPRHRLPSGLTVRAVICDVDGTLTDGTIGWGTADACLRLFNTKDGLGHHLLHEAGIRTAWLSATSDTRSIHQRAGQLGVHEVDAAKGDKGPRFLALCRKMGVAPAQVVYIGDDVNDLPAMQHAGLSVCPSDAHPTVLAQAGIVLEAPGGRGAFRELADMILIRCRD